MDCLFCGTFNPIHTAHLRAAEYVLNKFGYKKIIFIPTNNAPHKNVSGCSPEDRINMVKFAVSKNKNFEVSDVEFQSDEKSYTLNTIIKLNDLYNNKEKWPFIIGTDAFRQIKSWYKTYDLKDKLKFIVLLRDKNFDTSEFKYLKDDGYDFEFTNLDFCDISSTEIRQKVKNGEKITELVPQEVENYIYEHGLYKN